MFWCPVSVQVRCTMTQYSRCFHIRCSFSVSSRDDLHIQFIVYPRRRRPLFDFFFDQWSTPHDTNSADTACLLKIECSVTPAVMYVASNHMLWDDTPCRLIKMVADVSKDPWRSHSGSSSPRRYFGDYSAYTASHPGRVECWTAPQRRTRVPRSCAVQSSRLLSSWSVTASLMDIIFPVLAYDVCYRSSYIDGYVIRFFVIPFWCYSSFTWTLFLQLYVYFGHRKRGSNRKVKKYTMRAFVVSLRCFLTL